MEVEIGYKKYTVVENTPIKWELKGPYSLMPFVLTVNKDIEEVANLRSIVIYGVNNWSHLIVLFDEYQIRGKELHISKVTSHYMRN